MTACTCLAIVSVRVGAFSLAALEAMAMGKPMVMSDIGCASEQIISGRNGLLYPRGNVAALANALKLLIDGDVCDCFGKLARQHVHEHFSLAQASPVCSRQGSSIPTLVLA
jgi:L-malate glycosyltransferase